MPRLVEYLCGFYPADYEVIVYEAAQFPVCDPVMQPVAIKDLASYKLTGISTLYVPPVEKAPVSLTALDALGLNYILEGIKLVPVDSVGTSRS